MAEKILLGFGFLFVCCLLEVSSRPNNEASIQYLPFYGGAKGQYLEVKKDNSGTVVSEKIIAEENISGENVIKANNNGNLLSRVLGANLQNLKTLSTSLIRLNNIGSKNGKLNGNDMTKFKTQLSSLGETASNTIKLIEEIGDNTAALFKKPTVRGYDEADVEDDVGEEGISIDPEEPSDEVGFRGTIAEAKPIGLAVIGEKGVAASRPMATAVAQTGVALANPIATAVAGFDPSILGIEFNINQHSNRKGNRGKVH